MKELQNQLNILENQFRHLRVKQGYIESSQRENGETPEGQRLLNEILSEMSQIETEKRNIQIELNKLEN